MPYLDTLNIILSGTRSIVLLKTNCTYTTRGVATNTKCKPSIIWHYLKLTGHHWYMMLQSLSLTK